MQETNVDFLDPHREVAEQLTGDEELAKAINDLTPAPASPKPPTKKEWGKIMRLFFTVERGTLVHCGHKMGQVDYQNNKTVISQEPRNNCEHCWFAFFNENSGLVSTADECFSKEGEETLVRIRGKKFTKNFKKFMSTMVRFKAELDAQAELARKESNGSGEVNVSNGEAGDRNSEAGGTIGTHSEADHEESHVGCCGSGERADQQAVQD